MDSRLEEIKALHLELMPDCHFDHLAFAYINFQSQETTSWLLQNNKLSKKKSEIYFDIASMAKAFTLGTYFLKHQTKFTDDWLRLLEHRAGLPAYGALSSHNWREQIQSYPISDSLAVYSDYSPLRLMLEIGESELESSVSPYWDKVKFWRTLTREERESCPVTGWRNSKAIMGEPHDPNAYTIGSFCSHAGLFATVDGVAQTLLNLEREFNLLELNLKRGNTPYRYGWDGVQDTQNTLAGAGASENTFGFLGFTGTCMWINPEQKKGWVMLTNATQNYWHERKTLNQLRKKTGELVWGIKSSLG